MSGAHLTSARGCVTELRRGPVTEAPGSHLKERGLQLRAEDTSRPGPHLSVAPQKPLGAGRVCVLLRAAGRVCDGGAPGCLSLPQPPDPADPRIFSSSVIRFNIMLLSHSCVCLQGPGARGQGERTFGWEIANCPGQPGLDERLVPWRGLRGHCVQPHPLWSSSTPVHFSHCPPAFKNHAEGKQLLASLSLLQSLEILFCQPVLPYSLWNLLSCRL